MWMLPESQINSAFITSLHGLSTPDKFLSTELFSFLFSFQPSRHAFLLSFPPAQLLRPPDLACKRPLFYLLYVDLLLTSFSAQSCLSHWHCEWLWQDAGMLPRATGTWVHPHGFTSSIFHGWTDYFRQPSLKLALTTNVTRRKGRLKKPRGTTDELR